MDNARPPTVQETLELARHYASIIFDSHSPADPEQRLEDIFEFLDDLWIAVFDHYITRGFGGKMAVVINLDGVVEVLIWEQGAIRSIACSG